LLSLLPHTPISGLGINFNFSDDNIDQAVIDMLKTKENLNQLRTILNESITTAMAYKDNAILNLVRYHGLESAVFNFNYHHACDSAEAAARLLPGAIQACYDDATDLLLKVYDLSGVEFVAHQFRSSEQ
jgi:hypothetical protein